MSSNGLYPGAFSSGNKRRLPICFCLDVSGSMEGNRIKALNKSVETFFNTIKRNEIARISVDVSIITYGNDIDIIQGFAPINKMEAPIVKVKKYSYTPIGQAIITALKLFELRKAGYKERAQKYFQPWLVIITDGKPEGAGSAEAFETAVRELNTLEEDEKLLVFNIGVGKDVDLESLKRLSIRRKIPIKANENDLEKYFEFLGASSTRIVSGGMRTSELYEEIVIGEHQRTDAIAKPSDTEFVPFRDEGDRPSDQMSQKPDVDLAHALDHTPEPCSEPEPLQIPSESVIESVPDKQTVGIVLKKSDGSSFTI